MNRLTLIASRVCPAWGRLVGGAGRVDVALDFAEEGHVRGKLVLRL
jgi:hypothetical protein